MNCVVSPEATIYNAHAPASQNTGHIDLNAPDWETALSLIALNLPKHDLLNWSCSIQIKAEESFLRTCTGYEFVYKPVSTSSRELAYYHPFCLDVLLFYTTREKCVSTQLFFEWKPLHQFLSSKCILWVLLGPVLWSCQLCGLEKLLSVQLMDKRFMVWL